MNRIVGSRGADRTRSMQCRARNLIRRVGSAWLCCVLLGSASALAQSLTSQDIGAVGAAGSYSVSGATHTVVGSGADIWGTADEFRFAYQSLTGDGQLTARVTSLSNTNAWAKAGVMIRETLNADSRHAITVISAGNGSAFQYRVATGGASAPSSTSYAGTTPHWVRIVRQGNVLTGYTSTDGGSWTLRSSATLSGLSATVYIGLAVTSHLDGTLATGVFDNITVVTSADTTAPTVPTGQMATALSSSSIQLSWNASTDAGSGVAGYRLYRDGGTTPVAQLSGTSYTDIGLAASTAYSYQVAAYDNAGNESAKSTAAAATTLTGSQTLTSLDIGAVAAAGSYSVSGGTHTVAASGADIWSTADEFRYAYRSLSGDSQLTARVVSLTNTNAWAKAGVMTRETLDASSRHAMMLVTPGIGTALHYRTTTGGTSAPSGVTYAGTAPHWVRLVRTGNTLNGYTSTDGTSWTLRNTVTISLPTTVYVGLAVTSHLDGTLATGVFDNVTLVASATDTTPPTVPTSPAATTLSSSSLQLTWTAATDNVAVTGYRVERCQGASCTSFTEVGAPSASPFTTAGLSASTTYRYRLRATDAAHNASPYSSIVSATTSASGGGDTTPPSTPANLTATAASSSQINLSWTASTDNVAVTGYLVERCQGAGCSSFSQIATPTGTTYNDTGLTASTSYSYRVRARDAVPNYSSYSSTATATTSGAGDTSPPTTPAGLSVTPQLGGQNALAWSASTDNVAVTGYLIERCATAGCSNFVQIATPTGLTYTDTGLTPTTNYSYRVRARDAVPNYSGYSNTSSATPADCD